jgi:hypothetical protein
MTTTAQEPQPSEVEKLEAALSKLVAERQQRMSAGKWSKGRRPMLAVLVGDLESDREAMERGLAEYLQDHPGELASIHGYDWLLYCPVGPPPVVEPPTMIFDRDHRDAVDVTPPPYRPLMPQVAPPERATPKGHNNAGIPAEIHARELKRLANFEGDIYDPADAPLRYPRGNRNGW